MLKITLKNLKSTIKILEKIIEKSKKNLKNSY